MAGVKFGLEILKLGTVSVDGTHIKANASKHKSLRYDRIRELEAKLDADISELLEQARNADSSENETEHKLPKEVRRRQALRERLKDAKAELEAQHAETNEPDSDSDDDHKGSGNSGSGKAASASTPPESAQINLTDSDSRIMRKSRSRQLHASLQCSGGLRCRRHAVGSGHIGHSDTQ